MKLNLGCPHCFEAVNIDNGWEKIGDIIQCDTCGGFYKLMYDEVQHTMEDGSYEIEDNWWLTELPEPR